MQQSGRELRSRLHAWVPLVLVATGCSAPSVMARQPKNPEINQAVTTMWAEDITRVAQTGDWILTRSYSLVGDAITVASLGVEVSHASIYDAERGTVIEAITPHVREVPLEDLLARNRLAIVVRPRALSPAQRRGAVTRARAEVGTRFDIGGLIGIQDEQRFYCSELVFWASDLETHGVRRPLVITPASLIEHGQVVYLSGRRDDAYIQEAALAIGRVGELQRQ